MERKGTIRYRSIFWPILLIGVGVTWLLVNLGVISGVDWRILWRFWPLILIAIGLDIIFARRTPILGAILGLGTVALAILILALAPSLGLVGPRGQRPTVPNCGSGARPKSAAGQAARPGSEKPGETPASRSTSVRRRHKSPERGRGRKPQAKGHAGPHRDIPASGDPNPA